MTGPGPTRPLVLASASPRRAALLAQVGVPFEVRVSDVPEEAHEPGRAPEAIALEHARAKALAIAAAMPGRTVLGADTVVVLGDEVLGKPEDAVAAAAMLRALSGRAHEVITAIAVALGDEGGAQVRAEHAEHTRVVFRALSEDEIAWYVASGEPLDKAGAYGIQGRGALLVRWIEGCYFNVVGLPLSRTGEILAELGYDLIDRNTAGRGLVGRKRP